MPVQTRSQRASACGIARLPPELLSKAIALTTPRDACRAAAVSKDFLAAADSDDVWSCFLPELPPLADGELEPGPPSKAKFMRLSDRSVLLADGLVSMWLDRESGAKCYMLSAKALSFVGGNVGGGVVQDHGLWQWIPLAHSRFAGAAILMGTPILKISCEMHGQMLSPKKKYIAYVVFKITKNNRCLISPYQRAAVIIGEKRSTRTVLLKRYASNCSYKKNFGSNWRRVLLPKRRADGWMELEMGEFIFNEVSNDGGVSIKLSETRESHLKMGLIVHGVEIRVKK